MKRFIEFSLLKGLKEIVSEYADYSEDFIFAHFTPENSRLIGPRVDEGAFEGLVCSLCFDGEISMRVNGKPCKLSRNMLMFASECTIAVDSMGSDGIDAYFLFLSKDFLVNTHFDPRVMIKIPLTPTMFHSPALLLRDDETETLRRFIDLLSAVGAAGGDPLFVRASSRSIVSGMIYNVVRIVNERLHDPEAEKSVGGEIRSNYVELFLQLVRENHIGQRTVKYYADRIGISPKYLSLIVRRETGLSAMQWIDRFIIMEAKNMLRFSARNIQEITYLLQFPNQSTFGKYFKKHTGLSPSAFRRT